MISCNRFYRSALDRYAFRADLKRLDESLPFTNVGSRKSNAPPARFSAQRRRYAPYRLRAQPRAAAAVTLLKGTHNRQRATRVSIPALATSDSSNFGRELSPSGLYSL